MIHSQAAAPRNRARPGLETWTRRSLLVAVVAALNGQPNALFIYFPAFPVVALLLILLPCGLAVFQTARRQPYALPKINLFLPTTLFFALSCLSLFYAPDPVYGLRILSSMFFKFFLFLAIVTVCTDKDVLGKILLIIAALGGLFSFQGLAYVVGSLFFHLEPTGFSSAEVNYGTHAYNPGVLTYGILGFAKASNRIGGIILPRCQAMFMEPSSLATFLELSLFATLGWFTLTGYAHKKLVYWLIGLQLGALLFSFSSAGWLAVGGGALVYFGLRLFIRPAVLSRRRLTRLVVALTAIPMLAAVVALSFPSVTQDVYKAVYTIKVVGDAQDAAVSSGADRLSKASDSVNLFWQRPLFGWGSNQSSLVSANGAAIGNAFLTTATELGLAGLALYLAMLGAILATIVTTLRLSYATGSETVVGLSAALVGGFAALFLHSLFVDAQWLFCYWIGLALIYVNRRLLLQRLSPSGVGIPPKESP